MNDKLRKGINFDLDTNKLEQNYTKSDWHNAYYELRIYFEKEGFQHIQGSGYHSVEPMSESQVMSIVHKLTKKFPWINECVSVCTIADVPETTDISHVFVKEAQKLRQHKNAEKEFLNSKKIEKRKSRGRSR